MIADGVVSKSKPTQLMACATAAAGETIGSAFQHPAHDPETQAVPDR